MLTSDVCAAAIVGAARAYGDDPIRAVEAKRGPARRAMVAAAVGLSAQTGILPKDACRVLSIHPASYNRAFREDRPDHRRAVKAAAAAVQRFRRPPPSAETPTALYDAFAEAVRTTPAALVGPYQNIKVQMIEPASAPVDHTPLIRAALTKRAASPVKFTVAGVEDDKALLPPAGAGGCAWPMGDPRDPDYRACGEARLEGRRYCAAHLKAAGMKATAKPIQTVGRVARPYNPRSDV